MKNWILLALIFISFSSCQKATNSKVETTPLELTINKQEELASIMKTIKGETKCFFERDYECWKNYWVQEKHAYFSYNNPDGTFGTAVGWKQIDEAMGAILKNNSVKQGESIYPDVVRKNVQVKFFSDKAAYLIWEQYQRNAEQPLFQKSQEIRVMEKINENWKILHTSALWDYHNRIAFEEI